MRGKGGKTRNDRKTGRGEGELARMKLAISTANTLKKKTRMVCSERRGGKNFRQKREIVKQERKEGLLCGDKKKNRKEMGHKAVAD